MTGRLMIVSFIPSLFIGIVYLTIILWWETGSTPIDLINTITQSLIEAL